MNAEKYALISVFDKTGIVKMARFLLDRGYKIISTGGTAKILKENNITVIPIESITGNPESFDGRMKTISFQIESGILFDRSNRSHVQEAKKLAIKPIDIVVCNFYPFEEKPDIETIDIGGPTMVRAAAKNFKDVLVVIDPNDYQFVIEKLKNNSVITEMRQKFAAKAFRRLSYYDSQISRFFDKDFLSDWLTIPLKKYRDLRYGENLHQKAALYFEPDRYSALKLLTKLRGRDLSLVNITDVNAGLEVVRFFSEPAAVVIKHNSPCGIALGKTISQALKRAIESDPLSAFGGVIVLNKEADLVTVKEVAKFKDEVKGNIDVFASPFIKKNALEFLQNVRKSLGIYTFGKIKTGKNRLNYKWIDNGLVIQNSDDDLDGGYQNWRVVTGRKPSKKQMEQMKIAWKFVNRIRSNTVIVVDKNLPMTRGIGSGQTSRVGATKIALELAGKHCKNAILASDSFYPFEDSIELATKHNIGAIVQQGGSINDEKVIQAANKANIPMIFTNRRAFWH